jgi:hypothetical protein
MAQRSQRGQNLSLIDLGNRVREERLRRGISLDELSGRARVSRSMISEIERGTKAATVLVLDGIATGLETSLARLLASEVKSRIHVLRCSAQSVVRDLSGAQHRITKDADPGDHAGVRRPHANGTTTPGRGGGGASRVLRKAPRRVPSSRNGGKVHDK